MVNARPGAGQVAEAAWRSDDLVAQGGLAAPEAIEVLEQDVDHRVLVALRLAGDVRGDESVGQGPQRRRRRQRFLARHIQAGGGNALLAERADQRILVDDLAAADFMRASASALIRFSVAGVSGQVMATTSARPSSCGS